jgi:hypothetical protein
VAGVPINQFFNFIALLNLLFVDQVSVLDQRDLDSSARVSTEPGNLLGLFEILVRLIYRCVEGDIITVHNFLGNCGIAPLHQRDFLTFNNLGSILAFNPQLTPVHSGLGSNVVVLRVEWLGTSFDRIRPILNDELAG